MMFGRFERDERGSTVERFAIAAGAVALASLCLGSTIAGMAGNGALPTIAFLGPDQYVATRTKATDFGGVDYTATGSINERVDPCKSRQASP